MFSFTNVNHNPESSPSPPHFIISRLDHPRNSPPAKALGPSLHPSHHPFKNPTNHFQLTFSSCANTWRSNSSYVAAQQRSSTISALRPSATALHASTNPIVRPHATQFLPGKVMPQIPHSRTKRAKNSKCSKNQSWCGARRSPREKEPDG